MDPLARGSGSHVCRLLCTTMAGQQRPQLAAVGASLVGLFLNRGSASFPPSSWSGTTGGPGSCPVPAVWQPLCQQLSRESALRELGLSPFSRKGPGALTAYGTFQNLPWDLTPGCPNSTTSRCPPSWLVHPARSAQRWALGPLATGCGSALLLFGTFSSSCQLLT